MLQRTEAIELKFFEVLSFFGPVFDKVAILKTFLTVLDFDESFKHKTYPADICRNLISK